MVSREIIEEVKNRLVKAYNPVAIYIFGSHAWGNPSEDSDLDLLIIVDKTNEKSFVRPRLGYKNLRDLEISKDIIVYTSEEFEYASHNKTTLGYKIKNQGELIYARA